MLWWLGVGLIVTWFVLRFVIHQRGWVHLLLLSGASFLFVQVMAYRKTKNAREASEKRS